MKNILLLMAIILPFVLTSCGDDDEPGTLSLIGQWEITNLKDAFPEDYENYSGVVFVFTEDGRLIVGAKRTRNWYVIGKHNCIITSTDNTSGTIDIDGSVQYTYSNLDKNSFVLQGGKTKLIFKKTSGVEFFFSPLSDYRWYAIEGVDGSSHFYISSNDNEYMEIYFCSDGTGSVSYYDDYGHWASIGFEWEEYNDHVILYYYDGSHDTYYFATRGGYLYLSKNPDMTNYTVLTH